MATKIQIRRDTSGNWTSVNPLLAQGEMGLETDTNKFKFGDGINNWTTLAYVATGGGTGSGTSGTSGINGSSGTSGVNGSSGTSGVNGSSGTSGANGSSGTSGVNGNDGSSGTSGSNGSSGTSGVNGNDGSSGTSGANGSSGTSGISGLGATPSLAEVLLIGNSASSDIDLANFGITDVNYFDFNLYPMQTLQTGRLSWNGAEGTLDLGVDDLNGNLVVQQIGQELHWRVYNQTGATISNGSFCKFSGIGPSSSIAIEPATATSSLDPKLFVGVATETIINNSYGYLTSFGKVRGINLTSFTPGDILYLSATQSGGYTNVEPEAPYNKIAVAAVIDNSANGIMFVRPTFTKRVADLKDVYISTTPSNDDVLKWDASQSRWIAGTVSGSGGGSGTSGTSGVNGTSGTSGQTGTSGTSAIDGTSGTSGINGTSGTSAVNGTSGTSGQDGTSGTSGINGTSGTSAVNGTSGTSGQDGTSGTSGINGTSGTSGINGTSGTSGLTGTSGTSGIDGTSGTSGINGTSGTSGANGTSGTTGTSGTSGNGTSGTSGQTGTSGTSGVSGGSAAGTLILLFNHEPEQTGSAAADPVTNKTYTVAANSYSQIMAEAEIEFENTANSAGNTTFNIVYGGVNKRNTTLSSDPTGTGDIVQGGGAIKYAEAFTGGGVVKITTTTVANGTWTVQGFRVYGIV